MVTILFTKSRLYTPEQVAELLQVDVSTIYGYIKEKKLLATRLGRVYRIPAEAVEDLAVRGADPEAYQHFLLSKIRGSRQKRLGFSPEEIERDVAEAAQAVRHGTAD